MKKIRIIWYKAAWDKHWLDNAISLWTGLISAKNRSVGPYSHVEIWTADENGKFSEISCQDGKLESYIGQDETITATYTMPYYSFKSFGTCWTSTMRGKDNGTVKRPASTVIENAGRWDYCQMELSDEQYGRLIRWMESEVKSNKGYSKRDLLKFFGLGILSDDNRNICSEFAGNAIIAAMGYGELQVVSPRRLAWTATKAGYEIKPLKG